MAPVGGTKKESFPFFLMAAVWLFLPCLAAASSPFVTSWNVTASSLVLPNIRAQTDVTVDWGDGSALNSTTAGTSFEGLAHTYAAPGLYTVSVSGEFRWAANSPNPNLEDIVSWGDGFLVDKDSANLFASYTSLRVSADPNTQPMFLPGANLTAMFRSTAFDSPLNWDLVNVTSLEYMFSSTPLNKSITFVNTQGVTSTAYMFYFARNFNQPFSLDCANVTTLAFMFCWATAFNSTVSLTNTQKVVSTDSMFSSASGFNQPLAIDTRSVTNMRYMFQGASNFNQPVNFDTSQVTNMQLMFYEAFSFNQSVTMDTANVETMSNMFYNANNFIGPVNFTSTARVTDMDHMFGNIPSFTQDLSSWATQNVTTCLTFCDVCVLSLFPACQPCSALGNYRPTYVNSRNQSVCYSPAPTTAVPTTQAPSRPTTRAPTKMPTTSVPTKPTRAPSVAPTQPSSAPNTQVSAANNVEPLLALFMYLGTLLVSN